MRIYKSVDRTGQKFGRWTITGRAPDRISPSGRRRIAWFCVCECGKKKNKTDEAIRSGHSKSCGCFRKELFSKKLGVLHHNWKGGLRRDSTGYMLRNARGHPSADRHGYVKEHRLVMEDMVGRYLLPSETVHHRNGVKDDNRPVNLELRSGQHGKGFRYEDLSVSHLAGLSNFITGLMNDRTIPEVH